MKFRNLLFVLSLIFSVGCAHSKIEENENLENNISEITETEDSKEKLVSGIENCLCHGCECDQNYSIKVAYFDFDSYKINSNESDKIEAQSRLLESAGNLVTGLVVEGHADQRGTIEYNIALGQKRALSTKSELIRNGINEKFIKTISYGNNKLTTKGTTEQDYALNRRTETVFVFDEKKVKSININENTSIKRGGTEI